MNTSNPLESRLRSWTPRPPSPKVKQALFLSRPASLGRWHWTPLLAPALACFILAAGFRGEELSFARQQSTVTTNLPSSSETFASTAFRQGAAARFNVDENSIPARGFERLLGLRVPTNASESRILATNSLFR